MELNSDLAEQIVLHAQKVIKYPINVMDAEGVILASTNPSRRYQKHSGAVLALNQQCIIEVTDSMSSEMCGTQPGINLPILFKNNIVGVIGISGQPEEVRPLGELVKMAGELVLENAYVLKQAHWRERRKQDFLLQWIECNVDISVLETTALPLKVDLWKGYVACIIEVRDIGRFVEIGSALKRWNSDSLFVELSPYRILILLNYSNSLREWEQLKRFLSTELDFDYRCSIGQFYPNPKELHQSYQSAVSALELGKKIYPKQQYFDFEQLKLACILDSKRKSWQENILFEPLDRLEEMDPVFKNTLICWFENDLDATKTSETLFIHRNSLRYRLSKISEICNLDLNHYSNRVWLYVALLLK
ncbi:sugar diacid recognition domain-containing protein [Vibrio natriegens]